MILNLVHQFTRTEKNEGEGHSKEVKVELKGHF